MTGAVPGCERLVEVGVDSDAVLFRAWQPAFKRDVAVRFLPARRLEALRTEARRAAALAGHPNVVTVHDLGVTGDGVPYLVTELLERGTVADKGPLDWYDAVSVTIKVAGVLEAARKAGIAGLAVTPADVHLSRFDEPMVAVVGCATAATDTPAGQLRSLLRSMLATGAGPVQAVVDGAGRDVAGIVELLQRAQAEADRPVTGLPADVVAPAAGTAGAEDFSDVVTVVPAAPARSRRAAWAAGALMVVAASAAAIGLLDERPRPTTTTAIPSAPPSTGEPPPALLYRADFTGPEWAPRDTANARSGPVDGEYAISVRRTWSTAFWKALGRSRISVAVAARMSSTAGGRLTVHCGLPTQGNKFLTGSVRPDGSWEITGNDRVLATGAATERVSELREGFALRLDCVTDTSPTRATLFLNDRLLGVGDGTGAFALDGASVVATTEGDEPFEVSLREVTVTGR